MKWEFHKYKLTTRDGAEVICFRPYTPILNEYLDDKGYTDCYITENVIKSFVIRIYRKIGKSPPSLDPYNYIPTQQLMGNIYEGKIKDYSPFKNRQEAIDFIKKNKNYDYDLQKVGYPPEISVSELSRDLQFYKDPITTRKYFIDHHYYKSSWGIIRRRKVRKITTDNIAHVKIIGDDSPIIRMILDILKDAQLQEDTGIEKAKRDIVDRIKKISGRFSEVTGLQINEIDVRFGPYPPTKPTLHLRPRMGDKFTLKKAKNLVEFIETEMFGMEHYQANYRIPQAITGFYFEIYDSTHRMPVYTRGIFDINEEGFSVFY